MNCGTLLWLAASGFASPQGIGVTAGIITAALTFRLFFSSLEDFTGALTAAFWYSIWPFCFWTITRDFDENGWKALKLLFWVLISVAGGVSVYAALK